MTKRFGRPAPNFEEKQKNGPIRPINLPREGHNLEGLYAAASARSDMMTAPYEILGKENFNRGLLFWMVFALFWIAVAFSLSSRTYERAEYHYSDHQESRSNPE